MSTESMIERAAKAQDDYGLMLAETTLAALFPPDANTRYRIPRLYRRDGHIDPSGLSALLKMLRFCADLIGDGAPEQPPINVHLHWARSDDALTFGSMMTPELARMFHRHPHPRPKGLYDKIEGHYVRTPEGLKWVVGRADEEDQQ